MRCPPPSASLAFALLASTTFRPRLAPASPTSTTRVLFCQNVEWIKNRKVTLGCTSTTLYCPNDRVSRLQMAAFMNRLGTALTPLVLRAEIASGALDLDLIAGGVRNAPSRAIVDFPRRALVDVSLSGTAPTGVDIALRGCLQHQRRCELAAAVGGAEPGLRSCGAMGSGERRRRRST